MHCEIKRADSKWFYDWSANGLALLKCWFQFSKWINVTGEKINMIVTSLKIFRSFDWTLKYVNGWMKNWILINFQWNWSLYWKFNIIRYDTTLLLPNSFSLSHLISIIHRLVEMPKMVKLPIKNLMNRWPNILWNACKSQWFLWFAHSKWMENLTFGIIKMFTYRIQCVKFSQNISMGMETKRYNWSWSTRHAIMS